MYPALLKIGPLTIHSWGFFLSLAFVFGIIFAYKIASKKNPSYNPHILDAAIYVIIAAVICSRLLYILEHPSYYIKQPMEIIMVQNGGLNFAGGLLGALIAIFIYTRLNKISLLEFFDICTAPTFLGMAIGRIGCLLNGCCYGIETKLPWGIKFPETNFPVHPTQIYDLTINLIFMAYIIFIYKSKKYNSHVFLKGVFVYSVYRFFLEFIRVNPRYFLGLSQAQYISLGAFIIASFFLLKNRNISNSK